jgi:hypothetical protein
MSYCAPCSQIEPLYFCYPSIEIGIVADVDTDYFVYIQSYATGAVQVFEVLSDGDGLITIESDDFQFAENTLYQIWVNKTGDKADKEEFIINGVTNSCFNTYFMKGTRPTVERHLYINGSVLGNNTNETNMRTFLSAKSIGAPIFYLSNYLDDAGNRTAMRALNTLLNTAGVSQRGANVTQSVNAINLADEGTPAAYNVGCATAAEKFTFFSQEWEFWKSNPYGDFATFKTNDLAIYNHCADNNLKYHIYVARCEDQAGISEPEEVADWLVNGDEENPISHDVIYLVDYVSTAKFNKYKGLSDGIKTQIQLIANAAKNTGKVQKIMPLWASQGNVVGGVPTNMFTYFQANPTLIPAYNTFKTAYDGWKFTNKTSVKFIGQNIYAYDSLKAL